jgi:DNA (cytosine-5)-methyltransferase 1
METSLAVEGALGGESQRCSLGPVSSSSSFSVAGLFAGIGGFELGLHESGGRTELLCEWWAPAQAVLAERFPGVALAGDVRELDRLPDVDVVTAGFPCTDLSQAGRTKGITGEASGLVAEVFRLLRGRRAPVLVMENVRNMLVLDQGAAMRFLVDELESLGYRWAYRVVDSRFTGVPQRRQRVVLVASTEIDPRAVLFADDAGEPPADSFSDTAFGFYWTEGRTGVGWARDAIPTLKPGSTIGIPSPPAIWNPAGDAGRSIVTPEIGDAEALQGFPRGWTSPAHSISRRSGTRWKLVGNAVTVGVSQWVGERLAAPGLAMADCAPLTDGSRWPTAAFGSNGDVWAVDVSMWPTRAPYQHLADVVDLAVAPSLSARATSGFLSRAVSSRLKFVDEFIADADAHAAAMAGERAAA